MSEWISVNVRMPTLRDGEQFLVWDGNSIGLAWLGNGNLFSYDDERSLGHEEHITHWHPVPSPPEPTESKWISVSKELPSVGQSVLIKVEFGYTPDLVEARLVAIGQRTKSKEWRTTHSEEGYYKKYSLANVVAWQPLPE